MKKFLYFILLALPLFLCPPVYADTYDFNILLSNNDYINEDFLYFRDKVINYPTVLNNNKHYLIYFTSNEYRAYLIDTCDISTSLYRRNTSLPYQIELNYSSSSSFYYWRLVNDNLAYYNTSYTRFFLALPPITTSFNYRYESFLDSDCDITYTGDADFNVVYENYSFTLTNGDKLPSLYEIYNSANNVVSDNYPILTTFYTTVSEKIILFVNSLLDNYIYLFIFGIFILIFLIELIRRYLL